jgi:hypothetical protein
VSSVGRKESNRTWIRVHFKGRSWKGSRSSLNPRGSLLFTLEQPSRSTCRQNWYIESRRRWRSRWGHSNVWRQMTMSSPLSTRWTYIISRLQSIPQALGTATGSKRDKTNDRVRCAVRNENVSPFQGLMILFDHTSSIRHSDMMVASIPDCHGRVVPSHRPWRLELLEYKISLVKTRNSDNEIV